MVVASELKVPKADSTYGAAKRENSRASAAFIGGVSATCGRQNLTPFATECSSQFCEFLPDRRGVARRFIALGRATPRRHRVTFDTPE